MEIREKRGLSRALNWGTNVVVLLTLGAVGWWGHATHWTLPHSGQATATDGPVVKVEKDEVTARDSALVHKHHGFPNQLPVIEFSSVEAARNCGIDTEVASERFMDDVIVANGVVGYDQAHLAQLAVRVPGIVWQVEKRVGDTVASGDVLVIVDSAEVGQAKASLLEAVVVHNLKSRNLQRLKEIANSIPERDVREVEAACELSRVQRFNAVQKLVNLGFPLALEDITPLSTDELMRRLQLLGLGTVEVKSSSANLIPLIAPFSGLVTRCDVVRGEMVDPAKPQYVVADTRRMWINLDIRQEDAAKVKLGARVMYSGEGDHVAVACVLTWIGTEVDPKTRTIQARAEGDNPLFDASDSGVGARRRLQVNTFGTARIQIGSSLNAVVVSNDALHWQWEIGRQVVFVASDDRRHFQPRIVSKGLARDHLVQITEGLRLGERVVTAGSRILSSELSERLQPRLGENAEAVRDFDNVRTGAPSTR